ncbi:hypothetical protein FO519_001166 [Halicephalobus sp. NKZ332]|nr:hypothetical protein FO519_001166 [Halicephalobus sp. NKZ332]
MLPYLASYMRNRTDPGVSIDELMWVPTFQGAFPFAMVIGGFLSAKVGPRTAAFLGCVIMNGGVLLSGFTIKLSFTSFMLTYGVMFGLGQGIAYVVALSSVINWIPESIQVTENQKPKIKRWLSDSIAIHPITTDPVIVKPTTVEPVVLKSITVDAGGKWDIEKEEVKLSKLKDFDVVKKRTTFANTFIEDDMLVTIAFSVGTVANSISRIGWGYLADKFSFQFALTVASFSAAILLSTMPFVKFGGKFLYFFWLILMFISIAANQSLFIAAVVKSFGPKQKSMCYGFLILSTTISGVLLSTVCQTMLSTIGYTWMFISGAVFAFFGQFPV